MHTIDGICFYLYIQIRILAHYSKLIVIIFCLLKCTRNGMNKTTNGTEHKPNVVTFIDASTSNDRSNTSCNQAGKINDGFSSIHDNNQIPVHYNYHQHDPNMYGSYDYYANANHNTY